MSSVAKAIEAIETIASDLIILPGSREYEDLIKSYFSGLERQLKPSAFLTPSSASQVAQIVKSLSPFAADLKVAICGSGQQATPGVANVHDGLTIHLGNLRGVKLDTERRVVSVAAGEKMGKVYDAVVAAGLAVVGSRHSSGGIGGDALQGESRYIFQHI